MLVVHVCVCECVCVGSSGMANDNYTHTCTALNLEDKQNHFSDMLRFYEHCDMIFTIEVFSPFSFHEC